MSEPMPQSSTSLHPFHLAFPVMNLERTRDFYGTILGCEEGRSSSEWVDFNFFGHQLVAHQVKQALESKLPCSSVDGHQVPVRHFGLVLPYPEWLELSERLQAFQVEFLLEPDLRFKNTPGEQFTLFVQDPDGHALEFKSMTKPENLFARFDDETHA